MENSLNLYLGHNKIIGWENGLPVRSLTMPADYSKPFNKSTARLLHSQRFVRYYPLVASLCVTGDCNCNCPHCGAYVEKEKDLSKDVWLSVVKDCLKLGVFNITFTGGEPLLRKDLPEIINAIDRDSAICVLFTNGSLLKEKAKELYKAGLRRIMISIDYDNETAHDKYRGRKGLFREAIAGILEAKKLGMLIGISTFVTPERLSEGALEGIIKLGKTLKVNEMAIWKALPCGKFETCSHIKYPSKTYEEKLKSLIQDWQRNNAAFGIWFYDHVRSYEGCGCTAGISMFSISNSGNFRPCEASNLIIGSVLKTDLFKLWTELNNLALEKRKKTPLCWLLNE